MRTKITCRSLANTLSLASLFLLAALPARAATTNAILFVTQVPMPTEVNARQITSCVVNVSSPFGNHLGDTFACGRGGALWIRYSDGTITNLTALAGYGVASGFQGANSIAVREPHVHWSGTKALFSMVVGAPTSPGDSTQYVWQVYEITNFAVKGQLPTITKVPNQPSNYNNVSPTYGTDGRIIFASDRPRDGSQHLYPLREEYLQQPTVSGLWSLDPSDPNSLFLLQHSPSGSFKPFVDSFGRVIFTRWDHLSRDVMQSTDKKGQSTNYLFNYSSESSNAQITTNTTELFPEPRPSDTNALAGMNMRGNAFNQFFPWSIREDGTGEEVVNHIGRHELLSQIPSSTFTNDLNIVTLLSSQRFNTNYVANFFPAHEDPNNPGLIYGTDALDIGTHTAGQLVTLTAATNINADVMTIGYVTPKSTAFPNANGLYRDPLPMSNGLLVAVYAPGGTTNDFNMGTPTAPQSKYDFRLRTMKPASGLFTPDLFLTPGFTNTVSYYVGGNLITYNGPMWELDPVEVAARKMPATQSHAVAPIEAQVFADAGVDLAGFQTFLCTNNLALVVSRNTTARDKADKQQPYNLKVAWSGTQTLGSPTGSVYSIGYLQMMQADMLRGFKPDGVTPAPGRRVMGVPWHDDLDKNPPVVGGPPGSVQLGNDGSFAAILPARRAMSWQTTDTNGVPIVRERYWVTFQPGEVRTCANCHGANTQDQAGNATPTNKPEALATLLQWWKVVNLPQTPGRIVFNRLINGQYDVLAMNPDGTGIVNLTNTNATDAIPRVSYDGKTVVFMSDRGHPGNMDVWKMNADGSSPVNLTHTNLPGASFWAAAPNFDGSKIVYNGPRPQGGGYNLYVMNGDGTGVTNLTANTGDGNFAYWSYDGSKIVFDSFRDNNNQEEIYIMNANGSGQTRLTFTPGRDFYPVVSPDGAKIAFTSERDGHRQIYMMNLDGSGQTNISNNAFWDQTAYFSPDGKRISFTSDRDGDGNAEVYVMNIDGSGQTRITSNAMYEAYPAWGNTPAAAPPTTFTLTVNSGTGSGSYTNGQVVAIAANAPPAGQIFDKWTGATVANPLSSTTTLTMPGSNTTVTATYKALPPSTFTLTVNNGSGSGSYTNGQVVGIVASAPPAGQAFSQWTGATVANPSASSTTITMPGSNVTVTATYVVLPPATFTLTVNSGSGSGSYTNGQVVAIAANAPPAGQVFNQWTGATVANSLASSTTLTMPGSNTSVTATYKAAPPVTFTLTVNSGTGSGSYTNGQVVAIAANAPPAGQVFDKWTGATVANSLSSSTTLTMPGSNTSVTATYKAIVLPPSTNGVIFFMTSRDGNYEIYSMNPDGSNPKNLTTNSAGDLLGHASYDGTKVVFMSDRGHPGSNDFWLINSDGSNLSNVTKSNWYGSTYHAPVLNADGSKIVFMGPGTNGYNICTMNADGTGRTNVTSGTSDTFPVWSYDGSKIVFGSSRDNNNGEEIYIMNANGSAQTRLTFSSGRDSYPVISPDGTKIAFCSERDAHRQIYLMNVNGSGQTNISNNAFSENSPWFSPNGQKIVFTSTRDGNSEVYVMNLDGSAQTRLTSNTFVEAYPSWGGTLTNLPPPPPTFALTVNSGIGSGSYTNGQVVAIAANAAPAGQVFSQWTGATVANPSASSTTLVMPASNATVTATYVVVPPVAFTLTVNSGSGSGSYTNGQIVGITANAPPAGQMFDQWTGTSVANPTASSTTLTMPGSNTAVTATYKATPPVTFTLTVNSGSGSGSYTNGQVVGITANAAPAGKVFNQWTGATVASSTSASTTLTMPGSNTAVTATYKATSGSPYDVGPGWPYPTLGSVPWMSLLPGDLVNIHYQPGGYHEIVLLSNSGNATNHIVIRGIADPQTGSLPVIDGQNAITAPGTPFRASIFNILGAVVVSRATGTAYGYIPSYIDIENLHIQNANQLYTMTDVNGVATNFHPFASAIYVENAQHLTIRNCELNGSGNGFFVNSKNGVPQELSADVLVEKCWIHLNGNVGTYSEHNIYTECNGITFQYNIIGPVAPGSNGEDIKDRSAGTVIRYNKIIQDNGPGHAIWILQPQGGLGQIDVQPTYPTTYIYGNVIIGGPQGGLVMVRYDAGGDMQHARKGPHYFYNNTVINYANQSTKYYISALMTPNHSEIAGLGWNEVVDARNNMFVNQPATPGATPTDFALLGSDDGILNLGVNWISPGYHPYRLPYQITNFVGQINGLANLFVGDSVGQNNPHFVDLPGGNYNLANGANAINAGGPLAPQVLPTYDVTMQYIDPHASTNRVTLGSAPDLGAFESTGTPPPPTFSLTVVSGSGSGSYTNGQVVGITANAAPAGQMFDQWTGATVANPLATSTTLTMPASNVTVTATYKAAPIPTYALTVNNGSGSGTYTNGQIVGITANAAPAGQVFNQWTGATVANPLAASTTLTMPGSNTSVTATYKSTEIPKYTLTVMSGSGSGSYTNGAVVPITANAPPAGQVFYLWYGAAVANTNAASTTLTMPPTNTTVYAVYKNLPGTGTLQFASASYSVNENGGSILITVTRTGGSNGVVGVSYTTLDQTAKTGQDYTQKSGTLTWTNGDVSAKGFNITILNDALVEGTETFGLMLGSPTGGATIGSPSTATVSIIDTTMSPQPSTNGVIVFQTSRNGAGEVYSMYPDGSNLKNLTQNSAQDTMPVISKDGTKIVFDSDRGHSGSYDIWTMNVDGSGLFNVTKTNLSGAAVWAPALSPDNSKIVYMGPGVTSYNLWLVNADGSNPKMLSQTAGGDTFPSWSPDGSKIVFSSFRDDSSAEEVDTMDANGSNVVRLTTSPGRDIYPVFSPDGTKIAFTSQRDGDREVYLMNADGTGQTNLTKNAASDQAAYFSPDGTKIVFTSTRDGNWEIYTMNLDGSGVTRITNNSAVDVLPSWGPMPSPVQQSAIKSAVRAPVASSTGETAEPVLNPGTWTIQPPSFDIGFCPGSGRRGKAVTIVGINFAGVSEVLFNGIPAKFSVKSDLTILAKVPKDATTGPITLVSPSGTTTSMEDFEVEP